MFYTAISSLSFQRDSNQPSTEAPKPTNAPKAPPNAGSQCMHRPKTLATYLPGPKPPRHSQDPSPGGTHSRNHEPPSPPQTYPGAARPPGQ
ncbi:hypothetical protein ILYODFUR_027793 [Ilyodon furcidens]|uniref:Uncharacterized protein n=1 Tax=Ilyodon furcidens TaxID=33524 RepID=A0ABV0UNH9_9TELE